MKTTLKMSYRDVVTTFLPTTNYIVNVLIQNGAPIKITGKSKTDVSEYKPDEITITGNIKTYTDERQELLCFEFEK